jgi:hypothetical protein
MAYFRVPIFSMRSYETGEYAVLKDGNFQLHLNRASAGDIIAVPRNASDIEECKELFPEFEFVPLWYKENAYETRKHFWEENQFIVDSLVDYYDCSYLVTDITGYQGNHDVFFVFNITKDPENPRYYIDEFIDIDVESVNKSVATFVLNHGQKDVLVAAGAIPDRIFVDQRVINPSVMERYTEGLEPIHLDGIFHPFRISDPCYRFDQVVECAIAADRVLYITDPNMSFKREQYPKEAKIHVLRLTKKEYYQVLMGQPTIQYFEDPEKVFHPGLAEFIYFKAKINSPYNIPAYKQVVINE